MEETVALTCPSETVYAEETPSRRNWALVGSSFIAAVAICYLFSAAGPAGALIPIGKIGHGKGSAPTVPRVFHTIWLNDQLKDFAIAAIDSVARHSPDSVFKLHVITPAGAHRVQLEAIHRRLTEQLRIFDRVDRFSVQVVLHSDVDAELKGTPLEGLGITQAHLGGDAKKLKLFGENPADRANTFFGDHKMAMLHASDFMRILIMREGGIYLDTDFLLLNNLLPLVDSIDSFVVCEKRPDGQADGRCNLVNAIFGFTPNHPYISECLKRIAYLVQSEWSVNDMWPIEPIARGHKQACLTCIGTTLLSYVKNQWIDSSRDVFVIHERYPHWATARADRLRPVFQGTNFGKVNHDKAKSLTILGRRYIMPTSWSEVTLNGTITPEIAESYIPAYSTHLWEMDRERAVNVIRPNFLNLVRQANPRSVLGFLWRRACLVLCDDKVMNSVIKT